MEARDTHAARAKRAPNLTTARHLTSIIFIADRECCMIMRSQFAVSTPLEERAVERSFPCVVISNFFPCCEEVDKRVAGTRLSE